MSQSNYDRICNEFRYAALGEHCRTVTFMNPSKSDLGVKEWMEAECANSTGWDIKVLKFYPAMLDGQDDEIEQIYVPGLVGLTFGEAILKLAEYEAAQIATGYFRDPEDTGKITETVHFQILAEAQGMVFKKDGTPLARNHGLITAPGRFKASSFAPPKNIVQIFSNALEMAQTPSVVTPYLKNEARIAVRNIASALGNTYNHYQKIAQTSYEHFLDSAGYWGGKTEYQMVIATHRDNQKIITKNQAVLSEMCTPDVQLLVAKLIDSFEFEFYRACAGSILSEIDDSHYRAQTKAAQSALHDAQERTLASWNKINDGHALDEIAAYSKPESAILRAEEITNAIRKIDRSGNENTLDSVPPPPKHG